MQDLKEFNDGFRYALNVIDCFSKYAFSRKLLDKKTETVSNAFETIIIEYGRKPVNLCTDSGM